ncbi:hypothetical protein DXG01_005797 [Tephrocybe rancida]|nr:hypothetical protein DXG01_005797 [Tephrocybe rancida]
MRDRNDILVNVRLEHHAKHVHYVNVSMPPEAMEMIRDHVAWLMPVAMVAKIKASFPLVTSNQVHTAWQVYWWHDEKQLLSAKKLLAEFPEEVEVFDLENLLEGVKILAWAMRKIATPLKGKIVEIGLDATYNTNLKHLELYSIMAEYDNDGFPLTYCLLSTATTINQNKRTKALTVWATCVHDRLGVNPIFAHIDKDMAEIGMLRKVWESKINLCWWHLRRAVQGWLLNRKLVTTPYDAKRAANEYDFIDPTFVLRAKPDKKDYKGGIPDDVSYPAPLLPQLAEVPSITIPPCSMQAAPTIVSQPAPAVDLERSDVSAGCLVICLSATQATTTKKEPEFKLTGADGEGGSSDDDEKNKRPDTVSFRFLLCKHLVQAVGPVPPTFFLEVKQCCTAPFWKHKSLCPINEDFAAASDSEGGDKRATVSKDGEDHGDSDEDDSEEERDREEEEDINFMQEETVGGLTYEEAMDEHINTISELLKGLEFKVQFCDQCMLKI